jgi:hypothetical protein
MEHLAFASQLSFPKLCSVVRIALDLPPLSGDHENETEWASCEVDEIEYNLSHPFKSHTLRQWDSSVPEGCTVAFTLMLEKTHARIRDEEWMGALVESVGGRLARSLATAVHHHRTWLAVGPSVMRKQTFAPA